MVAILSTVYAQEVRLSKYPCTILSVLLRPGSWYATEHMTEALVQYIVHIIEVGGYPAVCFLMALESMVFPVPSEAVMPFAGMLVTGGQFTFWGAVFAATVGSIIGSIVSYYIGAYGGRPFIRTWGKYFLLNEGHLATTERFFAKYGDGTIFVSRFIPVVRHLISLPAGMGRMNLTKFAVYTVLGAGMWNAILLYTGMLLKERWDALQPYMHYVDLAVVGIILIAVAYFIAHQMRTRRPVSE